MTKKRSENAIILIGNGFDLAHRMKTSYNDFAEWYIETIIVEKLCNFNNDTFFKKKFIQKFKSVKSLKENKHSYKKESSTYIIIEIIEILTNLHSNKKFKEQKVSEILIENSFVLKDILNNIFLGNLYNNSYENWFDIENSYFFELTRRLEKEGEIEFDKPHVSSVSELNEEFSEIKNYLKEYLETIEPKTNGEVKEFFSENFIGKEFINIVNFNYTQTVNQYLSSFKYSLKTYDRTKVLYNTNYIHGELDKKIIFGYGDDDSENYKRMKQTRNDEYLKHFKTFAYLEGHNYRDLINLIDSIEDYEVYILGHSLSLTDKTLLYEIFSNKKCINIHLFKRADIKNEDEKNQDIKKLHFNISRILNNDGDSRKKIVPIAHTPHFPYIENIDDKILNEKYNVIYDEERNEIIKRDDSLQVTYS
ncbi:AbiH family protein [Tenacibaculum ovolyticum]|uniref:AbiH family protein n=1 Tax=Tenacibaculum ovolyticum TaxID=104270 RepID=UPI003BAAD3E7